MKIRYFLMVLCTSALFAQAPAMRQRPSFDAAKEALGLRDEQVTQLLELRKQQREALAPVFQQMREKQTALREALQSGSTDATAVGNLVLGTQALRKKVQESNENFRAQAVAVLDDQQKAKLAKLEEALKALPAIRQAAGLNLLDGPGADAAGGGPERPAMQGMRGARMARPGIMRMRAGRVF